MSFGLVKKLGTALDPFVPEIIKKDWVRSASIVVLAIGSIFILFSFICINGIFPTALLGGTKGVCLTISIGISILLVGGYTLYQRLTKSATQI